MNNRFLFFIILSCFYNIGTAQENQNQVRDSLFFYLDDDILIQNKYEKEYFYLKTNSTSTFAFLILNKDVNIYLDKKRIINFKEFLLQKFGKNSRVISAELMYELRKFKIFLTDCKNKKEIIEVFPVIIEE